MAVLALGVAVTGSATGLRRRPHPPAGYVADARAAGDRWRAPARFVGGGAGRPPPPSPVPRPVFLTIPAIGVRTPLIRLGLTTSGAMQVPGTTALARWYGGSPRPGAIGSAIIGGHVDSRAGPEKFSAAPAASR